MLGAILGFLNLGGSEVILIIFVALLLFGGEKLPSLARTLGRGIRDFKDASEDVKREIHNQINNYEDKRETPAKPAELPEHKTDTNTGNNDESKPLIDTTPVAGTMTFSGSPTTYNSDGVPMYYDENGYLVEGPEEEKTQEAGVHADASESKINLTKES